MPESAQTLPAPRKKARPRASALSASPASPASPAPPAVAASGTAARRARISGSARPDTPPAHGQRPASDRAPAAGANAAPALPAFMLDAFQRSVLFFDVLRQRGNNQAAITARPLATVLCFDTEELMSGLSLPRPINFNLSRVLPPDGMATDPDKRPVVVVDPRAGQGAGIGGFKPDSEIGDALRAGHPVYFIGFGAKPVAGQVFLDVVEGQVHFFEYVVARHPASPRPFAIGNCQAGYQTLMVAMLRPDLFGPCLVAGSPMSYWQGVRGQFPMRYAGGLLGGSWLNELSSDLGKGKIDGTGLIANFDNLSPAYWLWGKQYELYANIDTDAQRYLQFETWWGDFIEFNGAELQYLVDNMFIGDKLARGQLQSHDGTPFDLRNITSPIIVFTSTEDNISPPAQSLGWILDVYRDLDDLRTCGRTIVYCLSHSIGHLAIFVSAKVGAKEDAEFVQMMNVIDCLPPGLYEMVISPHPATGAPPDVSSSVAYPATPEAILPAGEETSGAAAQASGIGRPPNPAWLVRFESRDFDAIRALGRNSVEDDRAFAAVARMSDINLTLYRTLLQPWVRALATQPAADLTRQLNPLRLSYTLFADGMPWMAGVRQLAEKVTATRQPVADDNPFTQLQNRCSEHIVDALDAWRQLRDQMQEQTFFSIFGSPVVQALLGVDRHSDPRPRPAISPQEQAARTAFTQSWANRVALGGLNEALVRALLYVVDADAGFDERCAFALNAVRLSLMEMSLAEFKAVVREQFYVLQYDRELAIAALADMLPERSLRPHFMAQLQGVLASAGPPSSAASAFLARLARMLDVPLVPLVPLEPAAKRKAGSRRRA